MSYWGRKRTGAGVSWSGRGASGRSKSSRPRSSRNVVNRSRSRSTTARNPVQSRPGRDVRDRSGAERAEVPEHEIVDRRRGSGRTTEPGLGGRERHLGALSPEAARRRLHERELAARERERGRVVLREPVGERRPQLRPGSGLRQQSPCEGEHRSEVDAGKLRRVRRVPGDLGVDERPDERREKEAVVRADEMDGRAHRRHADDSMLLEQGRERLRPEAGEPAPERDVRIPRHLRLQPDQMLDRLEDRQLDPPQQELPLERRSVQRPPAQDLDPHGHDSADRAGTRPKG